MFVEVNGIKINYEQSGGGDVALVFLHYWGGTARSWDPLITALPKDVRSVAIDGRGWGNSDRPVAGYDIATLADDTLAVIENLNLKRYFLVGHSMGGKVAQLLASRNPKGLAGLVLIAPSPAQGKQLAAQEQDAMKSAYSTLESTAWTIDNILTAAPLTSPLREQAIADSFAGAPEAKKAWPTSMIKEDVSAGLSRIDVPTLVIGGERDKVDSVDLLQSTVVPSLPRAHFSVIIGVGHLLPLEAPHEVAHRIIALIDGEVARSRNTETEADTH